MVIKRLLLRLDSFRSKPILILNIAARQKKKLMFLVMTGYKIISKLQRHHYP